MSTVPEVIEAHPGDPPVSPLTTTITPVADTTLHASTTARSSASSSGSSHPMFSTGEATVIHVPDEKSNSTSTESATVESPESTSNTDIPPVILNLFNQLYTGLSYYDSLAAERKSLDFSHISGLFRSIAEEYPDTETDPKVKMATIAAKYIQEAEERDRVTLVIKEEVAKKIDYVNEMIKEQVELLQAKRGNITVEPKDRQEEEDREDHAEDHHE